MQCVIVGRIRNYLPHYGVAWVNHDFENDAVSLCEVLDTRRSQLLHRWMQAQCDILQNCESPIKVYLVSQNKSIRTDVSQIFEDTLVRLADKNVSLIHKAPGDVTEINDDTLLSPLTRSYRLLPELALEARSLYRFLFPEMGHCYRLRWVSRICDDVTTLTRYNAFMLGVIPSPHLSTDINGSSTAFAGKVSVYSVLSKCVTAMGKRRIERTLLHPIMHIAILNHRLSLVKFLIVNRTVRMKMHSVCMSRMLDVDKFTYQLLTLSKQDANMKKRTAVSNLATLVRTLSNTANLIATLDAHCSADTVSDFDLYLGSPLKAVFNGLKKLKDLVHYVFDIEKLQQAAIDPSSIILNPSLVDVAAESKEQIERANEAMEHIRKKAEEDLCGKIRLTATTAGKVLRAPKSVDVTSKYKLIRVNKNETQFTTMKLEELNEKVLLMGESVASCETAFIAKTLEVCLTYLEPLKEFADIIGDLDVMCTIAGIISLINQDNSWSTPEFITDESNTVVEIKDGRHCLLEVQESLRGRVSSVVPNSAVLNAERRSLLVTGPNMGGKSTYARQIALNCLLAQIGIPCPSKQMKLTPIELIWTRVGAHDSPAEGTSTFMTEASETAIMLAAVKSTKGNSMVVLDELGRGTSASDGLAFAAAVLKALLNAHRCVSVFATHFHELAAISLPGVHSLCMAAQSSLSSTSLPLFSYKIQDGVENDSDGIFLAKSFGFPPDLVQAALLLAEG
eukprot:Gregarina_sp_Poly_1__981@NODE_123_length_13493_cov_176_815135_g110_i0_p1_GENE_NODE_123_length_13493_cov_176_815135_g110_i0NODE_123_length_13493_cov_176_815135_g110_i0_p1_ORF_typecomplete_len734_score93_38MutS_V/PF00488_21/3_3e54MutS_III/PF05192_18/9_9e29TniB/PF05621_11/0_0006NTPase_1/PF03266_15/9_8e03NTPase_1/PF03266_15/0_0015MutS_IV/PF05190_18/0_0013AAA_PrkA/PF08298_11/0_13AAA_22/PF13401_6/0_29AAA_25/PF13481_6/7_9e03AAA_25/PF13481_6/0_85_NODE_123_length_13493_cov_176_815135_g110_i024874688